MSHPAMIKRSLWRRRPWWMHKSLLTDWLFADGEGGPPNNWKSSTKITSIWGSGGTYAAYFLNDAGEIGIWQKFDDDNGRWAMMIPAGAFRHMALWYLRRWAWGEWFGMRRYLFYRDLHGKVVAMDRRRAASITQASATAKREKAMGVHTQAEPDVSSPQPQVKP